MAACARAWASAGVVSIKHARVLDDQPRSGREDDRRDEQRGDRVALMKARTHGDQAGKDGQRAGHITCEMKGIGAQRGGPVFRPLRAETRARGSRRRRAPHR